MKTIYKCEICGKELSDWEECRTHEKTCEEIHATGLRLTKELASALNSAKERGGVKVATSCDNDKAYKLERVFYDARNKAVVVSISDDNGFYITEEVADNGNG